MEENKTHTKSIAAIVLVLFAGILSPLVENGPSCDCGNPSCWPELSGTMGENNWYVSHVTVTFKGTINSTFYRRNGGNWIHYTEPFEIISQGIHLLEWTCDSNMSNISSIEIKTDWVPPLISNITRTRLDIFKWQCDVNVTDEFSGVNRIRFFIDGSIDSEPPYQFIWRGCWLFFWLRCFFNPIYSLMHTWNAWDNAGNTYQEPS